MRIGIIGDTHFGFGHGSEREDDSFANAKEAFEKVIAEKPDFIILTGDIFDKSIPKPEVLSKAADILTLPLLAKRSKARLAGTIRRKEPVKVLAFHGIPVVAIHGTHERRPKGYPNPVEILEKMGLLVYLHGNGIALRCEGQMAGIQGLGGVPDQYFKNVLKAWSPVPERNVFNVLVFHQTIKPLIYTQVDVPEIADLPPGFDLYIDGHIHNPTIKSHPKGGAVIFTGSTIVTQMKENEVEKKRAWIVDVGFDKTRIKPIELDGVRQFKYLKVECGEAGPKEIVEKTKKEVGKAIGEAKGKPLMKVKVYGKLPAGISPSDVDLAPLVSHFSEKAIVSIDKELEAATLDKVEAAIEERVSLEETTIRILSDILEKKKVPPGLNIESLYTLLSEKRETEVYDLLLAWSKGIEFKGDLRAFVDVEGKK